MKVFFVFVKINIQLYIKLICTLSNNSWLSEIFFSDHALVGEFKVLRKYLKLFLPNYIQEFYRFILSIVCGVGLIMISKLNRFIWNSFCQTRTRVLWCCFDTSFSRCMIVFGVSIENFFFTLHFTPLYGLQVFFRLVGIFFIKKHNIPLYGLQILQIYLKNFIRITTFHYF